MPLLQKVRLLAAKIEATAGTIETLAESDAAFNIFNPVIQATVPYLERQGQAAFSQLAGVTGDKMATVTFSTEVCGNGLGGIPSWASTFLPACGWVATAQVYSPKSEAPGSNVKTLTIGIYENGLRKTIHGAMGDFEIVNVSGQIAVINWTFTGKWSNPTDVPILAPAYSPVAPFKYAAATVTIDGYALFKHNSLNINAGNEVKMREDASNATGYSTALVTGRKVTGSIDPEASLVATKPTYTEWLAHVQGALSLIYPSSEDTVTIAAPKLQRMNVQEAERSGNQCDNINFICNRSAAAGNDELTITFAGT